MPASGGAAAVMEAPYLITLPAVYTDPHTGELLEPTELDPQQWKALGDGHSVLERVVAEEYGIRQMFHPHADAHVSDADSIDRFLQITDPATVSLCLDTGTLS
jgi:inosose dehydratase